MTSAASKPSVLSCRWGLVLQRPGKKRPIFFTVPRGDIWETSMARFGFPLPACSFCGPDCSAHRKNSHLEPPLSSLGDINLPIRHTHPLCSFLTIFDGSLHPPSKAHFPPRLTSQRAHLLARTSTCPPPTPARIICNFPLCAAAVKCLIVMITTRGVPLTFAGLRKSPRGIRARWHNYGTSFVFVRDKSKR